MKWNIFFGVLVLGAAVVVWVAILLWVIDRAVTSEYDGGRMWPWALALGLYLSLTAATVAGLAGH